MSVGSKIKSGLKWSLIEQGLLKQNPVGKAGIVMYHGIDQHESTTFNARYISRANFEKQLKLFKKNFHVIPVADLLQGKLKPGRFNLALTFDDGLKNNFRYALPLLEKYQVPATFYITGLNQIEEKILWPDLLDIYTNFSDQGFELNGERYEKQTDNRFYSESGQLASNVMRGDRVGDYIQKGELRRQLWPIIGERLDGIEDYWELMSDEEIRQTAHSSMVTIGSHGFYHNNLGVLPLNKAKEELLASKSYLEGLIQKEVKEIAYPDGSYSPELLGEARALGLPLQLLVDYRYGEKEGEYKGISDRLGLYPPGKAGYQFYVISQHRGWLN